MLKFEKLIRFFADSCYRWLILSGMGFYNKMPDEAYLKSKYFAKINRKLNIEAPKSFNEKLQWLKLFDRRPEYTVMADKVLVKEYVAGLIGEEHIIPTLGVWNDPDEINFDDLPDKFVLKCNHNSGLGMCICKDKSKLDVKKVKKALSKGLKQDYFLLHREWPYKDIPRKIIAEQFLESDEGGLTDYKIHCFNGVPRFILVCKDRFSDSGLTEDFYTTEWDRMELKRPKIKNASVPAPKPDKLDEMIRLAETLSMNTPFLRVDFYFVESKIYFSELTFYPASGFEGFNPPEWDDKFGEWLPIPTN